MSQRDFPRRRRLPLAVRLSFILILAAVLPLLIAVGVSEYYARPQLIKQADNTLQTDARTNAQAIDAYLQERLLDTATLSQVPTVQGFLVIQPSQPPTPTFEAAAQHAIYALAAGEYRDKHYISWWIFYPDGTPSLSYPLNIQPRHYGQSVVPPEQLQAIKSDKTGQPILSPVYYDTTLHKAFIDIYSPIYQDGKPNEAFLGFMRASLNLDNIWKIVQDDQGFNKSGGAFILDQNSIRIADTKETDPQKLFIATDQPKATGVQQQINAENWYGQGSNATIQVDSTLSAPKGYEVASYKLGIQNWTYMVTSPSAAVTQVADDQLRNTIIVAIVVAVLAAAIGLLVSGRITRPIMRSVDQLRENSEALNTLAKKQQSASSEQLWVLDSIQVGQQSLQYYTDATRIAAHKLGEVGMELEGNWRRQNMETIKQGLQHVITAANYIEKATHYQGDSSQKLATAIKVTTQVNEQLADGAISATEAASQLEMVVNDLRSVIGQ
ncbi:MAG TPA: cache domain-containing protein [Ktedonobacteraceae bacterium]